MLYQADIAIPPSTSIDNPIKAVIKPTVGLLTGLEVYFRDGCLDAVGIRILDHDRQIAPMPHGWLRDNNYHIAWNEYIRLEGAPWVLTVEGYSIALDWEHVVTVRFYLEKG